MAERAELYAHIPPPGRPIPIKVSPFPVDDNILELEDISESVIHIRLHRAGGPSGMRAEHLRLWFCAAKQEEHPDPGNWEKVAAIIQSSSRGVKLTVTCAW